MLSTEHLRMLRDTGLWALANRSADKQHLFLQSSKVGGTVISKCWLRAAPLVNLVVDDTKTFCPVCMSIEQIRKEELDATNYILHSKRNEKS